MGAACRLQLLGGSDALVVCTRVLTRRRSDATRRRVRRCGDHFDAGDFKQHVPACSSGGGAAATSPVDLSAPLPTDATGIEAFNARMAAVHGGGGLTDCEHCGRSFHAAALRNHRKLCTAERPFKAAPASATANSGLAGAGGARKTDCNAFGLQLVRRRRASCLLQKHSGQAGADAKHGSAQL